MRRRRKACSGALALYSGVTQWLRLALDEGADPRQAADGVKRRIATATGLPDFAFLERELAAKRKEIRRIFNHMLSHEAKASEPSGQPCFEAGAALTAD